MADIFISYARKDRARVKPLVAALEAEGFSVFWDLEIFVGEEWRKRLEDEIDKAKAVVTVWTETSVASSFVRAESADALGARKLLQVRLEDVRPPLPFAEFQAADLFDFFGDRAAAGFQALLAGVRRQVANAETPAEPARQADFAAAIRKMRGDYGYRDRVLGVLNRVERALEGETPPGKAPLTRAFSYELLNLTLLLAVMYPVLSLFAQFALTGAATLGGFSPFTAGPEDVWARAAIGGVVFLLVVAILVIRLLRIHLHRPITGAFTAGGFTVVAVVVAFAVAVAGAYAFVFTGAGAVAFAGAVAGVYAVALTVSYAFAVAGASAFAVAFAGAFAAVFAGPVANGVAFAFALAVAFAGASAHLWLRRRFGVGALWLLAYPALALAALRLGLSWLDALPGGTETRPEFTPEARGAVIVFLVLLPAVNAVFDFLSIGLTRLLLRFGVTRRWLASTLALAAFDLVIGLALFVGLGCAAIMLIDLMRVGGPGGKTLIDLPALLADIQRAPGAYWWLYATFLSTLIPTALHAVAAIAAAADHLLAKTAAERAAGRLTLASGPQEMIETTAALRNRLWWSSAIGWIGGLALVGYGVWLLFVEAGFGHFLLGFFEAFAAGELKSWLRALLEPITAWLAAP